MDKINQSTQEKSKQIIHWLFMPYFVWEFGYASLAKVFLYPKMMVSMQSLGFNHVWTITIGYLELVGWIMVLIGLFKPKIRVVGILFLFPFSIGAFTAHMAHQEYEHFYASLLMCISSVVLLWSSKNFKMNII